ncbi:MAG: hypothetical protein JWM11_4085 [Planctomycetaceae bacterium]|nr:hypothetical protein [Planctomycetaceae bacterium]
MSEPVSVRNDTLERGANPVNEREIFLAALNITDPAARREFLETACQGNAPMRESVEALFASHEAASNFLQTPLVPGTDAAPVMFTSADPASSAPIDPALRLSPDMSCSNDLDDGQENAASVLSFLSPSTRPGSLGQLAHYEILELLGKGAFGTVLKGFDEKLHRMVAIKIMSTELALTSPARKRFLREARSAAAIRHEHVVAIYAVEEKPLPYLVMEYIPGQTLQQLLDATGPLELAMALKLGQQIAEGLAAAHSQGLIHRDIKPANILMEDGVQPKAKLTDFGLARAADDATLTQSGIITGTPMYMSPEQAAGSSLDQRSDLFSFGSVLYQIVTGRPPFRAATTLAVLKRVTEDTPRPIQELITETPDWLVAIISKLLAKNPGERFQSARELAELFAKCQDELRLHGKVTSIPGLKPPASVRSAAKGADARTDQAAVNAARSGVPGKRVVIRASVAVLVLLVALAIFWLQYEIKPRIDISSDSKVTVSE